MFQSPGTKLSIYTYYPYIIQRLSIDYPCIIHVLCSSHHQPTRGFPYVSSRGTAASPDPWRPIAAPWWARRHPPAPPPEPRSLLGGAIHRQSKGNPLESDFMGFFGWNQTESIGIWCARKGLDEMKKGLTGHEMGYLSITIWCVYEYCCVPRCSMYGIFTYIWVFYGVNVGKYSIHVASGVWKEGVHPNVKLYRNWGRRRGHLFSKMDNWSGCVHGNRC